jgi:DNA-binding HxlR family transcriptional regulator
MAMTRSSSPPGRPAPEVPRTDPADEEIRRQFQEFREAAVRLAERVRDLSATDPDPLAVARADLHLVRSIFGKWSSDVLVALHALPSAGFEELRRSLTGISPRVLSLKLKELEQNGMLHRQILDSRPPRVRYSLTERGWTVAWLSQPVLLYLRYTDGDRGRVAAPANADARDLPPPTSSSAGGTPRGLAEPGALDLDEPTPPRPAGRPGRTPIGRSRLETVAL